MLMSAGKYVAKKRTKDRTGRTVVGGYEGEMQKFKYKRKMMINEGQEEQQERPQQ